MQHDYDAIPECFQLQIWMHFFVLGIMFDIILCRHSIVGRDDFFQRQFQSLTKAKKSQRDYLVIRVRVKKMRPHTIIPSHWATFAFGLTLHEATLPLIKSNHNRYVCTSHYKNCVGRRANFNWNVGKYLQKTAIRKLFLTLNLDLKMKETPA